MNVFRIRHYCTLLTDTDVLSFPLKHWLTDCLTAWLRAVCLSAFACELQITAPQHRACSRQRQGFTLSSAPRSCLWVLCHMTLTEIDLLPTSRSCCATQRFLWCCNHHLKDENMNSPLSICNWVTMTWSSTFLNLSFVHPKTTFCQSYQAVFSVTHTHKHGYQLGSLLQCIIINTSRPVISTKLTPSTI